MSFQALLADLEALSTGSANEGDDVTKSMAADGEVAEGGEGGDDEGGEGGDADDAQIAAAAADGEAAGEASDDEGEAELGKSLTIVGENGEQEEAIDATDLIKSLVEQGRRSPRARHGKAARRRRGSSSSRRPPRSAR
jgi:hypothetical protein